MKHDIVFKYLTFFSIGFILAFMIELVGIILFSSKIELKLGIYTLNLITLIFTSGFTSVHVVLEWLLLVIAICGFLALGLVLLIISLRKTIKDNLLPKFLLLIGLFFLISGFIKMHSIYSLANSVIHYNGNSVVFQIALYTDSITPFIGALMWIYFSAISMAILISGLVISGVGLKLFLKIEGKSI